MTTPRLRRTAQTALAAGAGTLTFDPVPQGAVWLVERVTVAPDSGTWAAGAVVTAYVGSPRGDAVVAFKNATAAGDPAAVLELENPAALVSGETLIVSVSGAGAVATVMGQVWYRHEDQAAEAPRPAGMPAHALVPLVQLRDDGCCDD